MSEDSDDSESRASLREQFRWAADRAADEEVISEETSAEWKNLFREDMTPEKFDAEEFLNLLRETKRDAESNGSDEK